ncbi:hypothetical protein B0H11DRAFT_2259913 [Mycena galericulata]|nr:hypothetical protein B0H11DRAFT_2259913 [Mycena galericulata]
MRNNTVKFSQSQREWTLGGHRLRFLEVPFSVTTSTTLDSEDVIHARLVNVNTLKGQSKPKDRKKRHAMGRPIFEAGRTHSLSQGATRERGPWTRRAQLINVPSMRMRLLNGVPKKRVQLPIFGVPYSVMMSMTLSLVRALGESMSLPSRLLLKGHAGCGKSFLLLQAAEYVSASSSWLVLSISPAPTASSTPGPRIPSPSASIHISTPPRDPSTGSAPPTPTSSASYHVQNGEALPEGTFVVPGSGDNDEPATPSAVPAAPHRAAAEAFILNASTPLSTRLRTALCLYRTTTTSTPAEDRRLALLLWPVPFLSACLAAHLWDANLGLGVDEAAARLPEGVASERLRTVSARVFSETVFASEKTEERERTLNSARALGGRVGLLATRVGRILGGDAQVFRCTLGSSEVFEDVLVEEARDRVVDLLTGEQ